MKWLAVYTSIKNIKFKLKSNTTRIIHKFFNINSLNYVKHFNTLVAYFYNYYILKYNILYSHHNYIAAFCSFNCCASQAVLLYCTSFDYYIYYLFSD